jgi:pheromone shutdown protein TraB
MPQLLRATHPLTCLMGIVVSWVTTYATYSKVVSCGLILTVIEAPLQKSTL